MLPNFKKTNFVFSGSDKARSLFEYSAVQARVAFQFLPYYVNHKASIQFVVRLFLYRKRFPRPDFIFEFLRQLQLALNVGSFETLHLQIGIVLNSQVINKVLVSFNFMWL